MHHTFNIKPNPLIKTGFLATVIWADVFKFEGISNNYLNEIEVINQNLIGCVNTKKYAVRIKEDHKNVTGWKGKLSTISCNHAM